MILEYKLEDIEFVRDGVPDHVTVSAFHPFTRTTVDRCKFYAGLTIETMAFPGRVLFTFADFVIKNCTFKRYGIEAVGVCR